MKLIRQKKWKYPLSAFLFTWSVLRYSSNPHLGEQLKTVHLPIWGTRQNVVKSSWAHLRAQVFLNFWMRTLWGVLFCLTANTSEKLRCTLEDRESWQILFTCQELKCDVRVFATSVHWTCYFCETYSLNPRVIEQWNYLSFSWSQILQYEFAKAVRSALLYLHVSKWNH